MSQKLSSMKECIRETIKCISTGDVLTPGLLVRQQRTAQGPTLHWSTHTRTMYRIFQLLILGLKATGNYLLSEVLKVSKIVE